MQNYINHYINHYEKNKEQGSGMGLGDKPSTLKRAGYKDTMTLLDYGCGCGFILEGINPKDYLGVDIVPWAVAKAKEKFPERAFKVIKPGELKTVKKDFAIALSVFTHTPCELAPLSIKDIYNNLKKNGTALIDILEGDGETAHIRYWQKKDFIELLEGFTVKEDFQIKAKNGYTHTFLVLKK